MAMARIFHDQPAITEHKEKMSWQLIKRGVLNVNVMIGAWIYICDQITVQGLSIFTATILRLNFPEKSLIQIQLLSAAPPLVGMVVGLTVAYITMKTRKHGIAIAGCAALCVLGYAIWIGSENPQARFAAIFFNTAGGFSFGVLILGWTLSNAAPDTIKNVANGAVSGLANIGMHLQVFERKCTFANCDKARLWRLGVTSIPMQRLATELATRSTRPPQCLLSSQRSAWSCTRQGRTRSVRMVDAIIGSTAPTTRWPSLVTFTQSSATSINFSPPYSSFDSIKHTATLFHAPSIVRLPALVLSHVLPSFDRSDSS